MRAWTSESPGSVADMKLTDISFAHLVRTTESVSGGTRQRSPLKKCGASRALIEHRPCLVFHGKEGSGKTRVQHGPPGVDRVLTHRTEETYPGAVDGNVEPPNYDDFGPSGGEELGCVCSPCGHQPGRNPGTTTDIEYRQM
jgi:hypothetical protein